MRGRVSAAIRLVRTRGLDVAGAALVAGIVAVVWRAALFGSHAVTSGDLYVPFTRTGLLAQFTSFWNPVLEFPNVETISRLPFVAPFLLLGEPAAAQKGMIVAVLFGAGLAMFWSARRLRAPWILAVLAGAVYACNPWVANRLQHLFLLPGYAALPALVAVWLRPPHRGRIPAAVALLTVGSATPHTAVGLWVVVAILTVARSSGRELRAGAATLAVYTAVNAWWWLPTSVFAWTSELVPSWPTWDQVELFSRHADLLAVLRLEGYWWPLAAPMLPSAAGGGSGLVAWMSQAAGLGVVVAALVAALAAGLARWRRARGQGAASEASAGHARSHAHASDGRANARESHVGLMLGLAAACAVMGMGTNGPAFVPGLVVEGAVADRFGWLLRDPNKFVGALACFLLLAASTGTAARGRGRRGAGAPAGAGERAGDPGRAAERVHRRWALRLRGAWGATDRGTALRSALLGGYLLVAGTHVGSYAAAAYRGYPPAEGLRDAAAWLAASADAGAAGRAAWVPAYRGARTYWNGEQLTPEVAAASSPVPALSPYGYDGRAQRAFRTLDAGALLGDVPADAAALMRRWAVRWLVHHRDLLPARLQPDGSIDPRVELRAARMPTHGLDVAWEQGSVTIHTAGAPPAEGPVEGLLAQRPTATAALLSLFDRDGPSLAGGPQHVTVADAHAAVEAIGVLEGDAPETALTDGGVRVPLAEAAPRADPAADWSRVAEASTAWWPVLAGSGGEPPDDATAAVTTHRPGAVLAARARPPDGPFEVWIRAYHGPGSGAVRVHVPGLVPGSAHASGENAPARSVRDVQVRASRTPAKEGMANASATVVELVAMNEGVAWRRLGVVEESRGELEIRLENVYGANAIAEMRLLPAAAARAARARARDLERTWLWAPPTACRDDRGGPRHVLEADGAPALPWHADVDAAEPWSAYRGLELRVHGLGDDRTVQVWTDVDGTWVEVGGFRAWWSGWRTVVVPVARAAFWAAPEGWDDAPGGVRVVALAPAGASDVAGAPEPLRVAHAAFVTGPPCAWEVVAPRSGPAALEVAGGADPFPIDVAGARMQVEPGTSLHLTLPAGAHRITFPDGVPRGVRALALAQGAASGDRRGGGGGSGGGGGGGDGCGQGWRLWRTNDRFVDGLQAEAGGVRLNVVPVDGIMAGVWLPPGVCEPPELRNPWIELGRASFGLSSLAVAVLLAATLAGRLP